MAHRPEECRWGADSARHCMLCGASNEKRSRRGRRAGTAIYPFAMKWKLLLCVLLGFALVARAAPVDVSTRTQVTSANPKSTLDRASNRVTSTVDVTIKNTGDRALEKPFTARVSFTAQSGSVAGLIVPGGVAVTD